MNKLIKKLFSSYRLPVAFLHYDGDNEEYVVYMQTDRDLVLCADNALLCYEEYYDFDVYSKGNYKKIIEEIKEILEAGGFSWQPERDSSDMYEPDTGYYHKTVCFSIERMENNGKNRT